MNIRKPAVAGTFYEGAKTALESQIHTLVDKNAAKVKALGVMAPHAGYLYSGAVAGAVYSRIEPGDTFLILGPNHTGIGPEASIYSNGSWDFPMGSVDIDEELAKSLMAVPGNFTKDELAHLSEHSLEVQVPFLQYLFSHFKIVPICLGRLSLDKCLNIGKTIAEAVKKMPGRVVIVASSDMSHYISRESAAKKDRLALDAIEKRDPVQLFETVNINQISMCGAIPTVCALAACNELGATEAFIVQYSNSGDITGDYRQVVAYAGAIIK